MKTYKIALLPGDGIGRDVTDAAWAVLGKASRTADFALAGTSYPWSCDYYLQHGTMMPADGIDTLKSFDAVLLGAVGWPAKVPDSVSLHGLLLPIRKAFVQYANIRPHRLLPGVRGPLKANGFDILCIRENTEGEYSGAGGRVHQGTDNEVAVETSIFTRKGRGAYPALWFRTGPHPARKARFRHQVQRAEIFDGVLGRDHAGACA